MSRYAWNVSDDADLSVDEALAEITVIIDRLNTMGPGDPERAHLVARRDELRESARHASVASRSTDVLRYERDLAQRQLDEIDARISERSRAQKRALRWIIDPGSEANRIDRLLREQDAENREELEHRIAEIDKQLAADE